MAKKPTAAQAARIAVALSNARANKAAGLSAFGTRDRTGSPYAKASKSAARPKPATTRSFKPDNGPGMSSPDHYRRDRKGRFA